MSTDETITSVEQDLQKIDDGVMAFFRLGHSNHWIHKEIGHLSANRPTTIPDCDVTALTSHIDWVSHLIEDRHIDSSALAEELDSTQEQLDTLRQNLVQLEDFLQQYSRLADRIEDWIDVSRAIIKAERQLRDIF